MKHRNKISKLKRKKAHKHSLLANLSASLIRNEYIVTTLPKAKACKAFTDKIISLGKRENSNAHMYSLLRDKHAVSKIQDVLIEKYKDREGGFVRIIKLGRRPGDNARKAKLVLVGSKAVRKKVKKVKTRKKKEREEKDKKQQGTTEKKTGVLEKVRQLRGKIGNVDRDKQKEGQTKKQPKSVDIKSRSGI